jgi:hypothetical protein
MEFKINGCFEQVERYSKALGFVYDTLLRTRIDLIYKHKIDLNFSIEKNSIYIPTCENHHGFNDQFFLGNFSSMEKLCQLFIEEYCDLGIKCHPEIMYRERCKRQNLKIISSSFIDYGLLRPWGIKR